MDSIELLSPAKVNLRLIVLKKRGDGYHELQTIMQLVDLYDDVKILKNLKRNISLQCRGEGVPSGRENLAYRAAQTFFEVTGGNHGVDIFINKRIPTSAGLGGGSSNAASVIMGLNRLYNYNLSNEDLRKIGRDIGADVPFFIFRKTAVAGGIGEELKAIDFIPNFWFILVNPGFEVSTAWAFRNLNLRLTKRAINTSINSFTWQHCNYDELFQNDLEKVTIKRYPVIQEIKDALISSGAYASLMSGSGPTVFGIFSGKRKAQDIMEKLCSRYNSWRMFLVKSI